ncbi:hypothetical protein [Paraburkholderia youngii]|uniref:Uncharacterized protein n=1 Tax=Paraburkholderia youngii TaxID=2782701 RepID=A0A7Y6K4R4_9BURK|nr:hypothetical protein [Paraburkholderia youngii]NUY04212.1 hypothetical protein [Paraburkholderia youngii]
MKGAAMVARSIGASPKASCARDGGAGEDVDAYLKFESLPGSGSAIKLRILETDGHADDLIIPALR